MWLKEKLTRAEKNYVYSDMSLSGQFLGQMGARRSQDNSVGEKLHFQSINHRFEPRCRRGFSGMDL